MGVSLGITIRDVSASRYRDQRRMANPTGAMQRRPHLVTPRIDIHTSMTQQQHIRRHVYGPSSECGDLQPMGVAGNQIDAPCQPTPMLESYRPREQVDHRSEQLFALRCGDIHGSMAFIVSSKGRSPTFGNSKSIHHWLDH